MPNEIYHRSNFGNPNAEGFGDVYYDHAATNKLYNHSDYYENSDGTDATLKDLNNKASIVLTPTAYSDGSLNTVIPPYQVLPTELVTNGNFDTDSNWSKSSQSTISGGKARILSTDGSYQFISQTNSNFVTSQNKIVKVTLDITNYVSGTIRAQFSGGTSHNFPQYEGTHTLYFLNDGSTGTFNVARVAGVTDISIDNVSVKEIQEADFDFSRGSSATRVNEQGLVEDVQILSGELVQNGNFEQIGSEISNDVNFDNPSNWSLTGQSTVSNGKAHIVQNDASNSGITANTTITNKTYKITGVVSDYVSGSVGFASLGSTNPRAAIPSQNGAFTIYYTSTRSTPSTWNIQRITSPCDLKLDNVSVKEVGQNWSFGTGWSMGDGKAIALNTLSSISQSFSTTTSSVYKVTFTVLDYVSGDIKVQFTGGTTVNSDWYNGNGTFIVYLTALSGNNSLAFKGRNGAEFTGSIDNISIVEVTNDTDLPRIDFTDGTGSLLLEPQRTNSVPYSNDFSQHALTGGSITSDDIVSPDGSVNADTFAEDTNNSQHKIREDISVTLGTYTMSCFVKGTDRFISFYPQGISTAYAVFDIANENVTASGGSDYVSSDIQNYGSGWYRCSLTYNVDTGTSYTHIYLSNSSTNPSPTYTGNGSEMSFYGLQLEAGDYPTSYIPTSGSTVTRSADIANNSGNADLFNDSEGVLYAEISTNADSNFKRISINSGTYVNSVFFDFDNTNNLYGKVIVGGSAVVTIIASGLNIENNNKIALSYKENDFKLFVNGSKVGTDVTGATPTGLNNLAFDLGGGQDFYGNTKCVAVFKEALSNDLLERLTGEGYESFRLLAEANNYTII